jgi:hypothetical protein
VVPAVMDPLTVACASPTTCVAGGEGSPTPLVVTTDGGTTWGPATVPGSGNVVYGASCRGERCLAMSLDAVHQTQGAIASADGGVTWASVTDPPAQVVSPFACGAAVCAAVGGASSDNLITTADFGQTWSEAPLPAGDQAAGTVSCPGGGLCLVPASTPAGPVILRTSDLGGRWSAIANPTGMVADEVTCSTASACVAVGDTPAGAGASTTSTTGGRLWTAATTLPGDLSAGNVACSAAGACAMVVGSGATGAAVLTSSDGGQSWSTPGAPVALVAGGWVTCAGRVCEVLGASGADTVVLRYWVGA